MRPCLVVSGTEAVRGGVFLGVSSPWERCSSVLRLASIDESQSESESETSRLDSDRNRVCISLRVCGRKSPPAQVFPFGTHE